MPRKKTSKERLTITMRQDILDSLDRYVDGDKIRNRSHAIEYIVGRHLGSGISTCVILAAGKDGQTNKPLLRIHNRPVIAYVIDQLKSCGIYNIVLVINAENVDIKNYLEDGSQWGVQITYVEDTEGAGSAQALHLAKPHIEGAFMLMYGDILADIDLTEMIEYHRELDQAIGTLAVTACTNPSLYGVTEMQGQRIYNIIEKPFKYDKSSLVFSGIGIFEHEILEHITDEPGKYIARDILPDLAHRGLIGGYPFLGKWFDVSHEEEYQKAKTEWVTNDAQEQDASSET